MLTTKKPVPWRPRQVQPMSSSTRRRASYPLPSFAPTTGFTRLVHRLLRLCGME
jgi:hypothetical protein